MHRRDKIKLAFFGEYDERGNWRSASRIPFFNMRKGRWKQTIPGHMLDLSEGAADMMLAGTFVPGTLMSVLSQLTNRLLRKGKGGAPMQDQFDWDRWSKTFGGGTLSRHLHAGFWPIASGLATMKTQFSDLAKNRSEQ